MDHALGEKYTRRTVADAIHVLSSKNYPVSAIFRALRGPTGEIPLENVIRGMADLEFPVAPITAIALENEMMPIAALARSLYDNGFGTTKSVLEALTGKEGGELPVTQAISELVRANLRPERIASAAHDLRIKRDAVWDALETAGLTEREVQLAINEGYGRRSTQ